MGDGQEILRMTEESKEAQSVDRGESQAGTSFCPRLLEVMVTLGS